MHSSRMRTACAMTGRISWGGACHARPPSPHMPPLLPCTPPLPHTPPLHHTRPPSPCTPLHHACPPFAIHAPPFTTHAPPGHARSPGATTHVPPCGQNVDTRFWKYYLAPTSLRAVNMSKQMIGQPKEGSLLVKCSRALALSDTLTPLAPLWN